MPLSSCARAATAAEARYRIDARSRAPRATRVIALDAGAAQVVDRLAHETWEGAEFLHLDPAAADGTADDAFIDIALESGSGERTCLSATLADADFVMMVATNDLGAAAATAIGDACTLRGIMTAALVLGRDGGSGAAVAALRPNARVLLVSDDQQDVDALLTAVGS
jgi:hypothetical protein